MKHPVRQQATKIHRLPRYRSADAAPGKATPVEMLRVRHRMQALVCLRDMGPLSRVELCRQLGQSTTTMTKVIGELMALGWVAEGGRHPSREVGRPRTTLLLAGSACSVLVLVVEPNAISSARVCLDLAPHDPASRRYENGIGSGKDAVAKIRAYAAAEIARLAAHGHRPDGIAVVAPCMTDTRLRVCRYAHLLGWRQLDIATPLEAAFGLPAIVCNNTRCMALAEFRHLRLQDGEPMLFVQARYGLGAALVDTASPGSTAHLGVSELGQIPLGENRFADRVPTGRQFLSVLREGYLRAVLQLDDPAVSPVRRMEEAGAGRDAGRLRAQTADNLSSAIGVAVNLLNPTVIVIGGIYAEASDAFLDSVRTRLDRHAEPELVSDIRLQRTALGPTGAFQGGAMLAFDRLLRRPATYKPTARAA